VAELGGPLQGLRCSGLRTAVAGDAPPLLVLPCLSELPRPAPSRVLVRGTLPAVPPASRSSMHDTVRDRGPGCSHRLGRPSRVWPWLPVPLRPSPCGDPPGVPVPYSGRDLPESVLPGVPDLRHGPSSAFRTPSTVCSSNRLPALLRPVPLLGFSLQSLAPPREAVRLSAPIPSCRS
jgi:hypothetical protein